MIILEDESRNKHEAKYLSQKTGLSGGWRGFSLAHSLVEGDILVFQLVEPTRFKVIILDSCICRAYISNNEISKI